jgi:hypothetical protein
MPCILRKGVDVDHWSGDGGYSTGGDKKTSSRDQTCPGDRDIYFAGDERCEITLNSRHRICQELVIHRQFWDDAGESFLGRKGVESWLSFMSNRERCG